MLCEYWEHTKLHISPKATGDPPEEGMATHWYSCLENPHGQRSLADYSPQGHKKSDMTEQLSAAHRMYSPMSEF